MTEHSSRFLIVRLGSLGDIIHAIPAAAALRARYPSARIDWLVDPRYTVGRAARRWAGRGYSDRSASGSWYVCCARSRHLRRAKYDAAVDLQGLLKSAVLTRAAGARRVIGLPREHLREPMSRMFYGETPDPGRDPHVIRKNLTLMQALGVQDVRITFPLKAPRTVAGDTVAARFGSEGFAVINPGAAWPNKRWPPQTVRRRCRGDPRANRRAVARALGPRRGATSPRSSSARRAVRPNSRHRTNIIDLFAIARRAKLVVSGDTGPLHIAAAVGTPVVALFGPTFAERNGPWSPADITISRAPRCSCHYERKCRLLQPCIEDIGVDEVVSAAEYRVAARG